jgi:enamine deaminase RidA (YjgF/YER057c/UK114 family)
MDDQRRDNGGMDIIRHNPGKILSSAVEYGNLVFVSGTIPDNPDADMKAQTANILAKIDAVLAAAGTNKSKVLSANIWVTDIRNRDAMNEAWLAWIDPANPPARATVEAKLADPRWLVEISVIAAK